MPPFWVVKPTVQDRDTCLCKTHANLQFIEDKLQYHKVIRCSNIENLIESLCCENLKKECMYRECPLCQAKELKTSDFDAEEEIESMEALLPDQLETIHGTMKIHQIVTDSPGEITWRILSCFCSFPHHCSCFSPQTGLWLKKQRQTKMEYPTHLTAPSSPLKI
ncbi:hypothetical protein J4Q44_G00211130 [Coregonus suidteri]|uniref:Uncharacterized protein n=1 Tax=Coregonus suidteri TaxID=861788 RepID=A0AAN8LG02_9TELE